VKKGSCQNDAKSEVQHQKKFTAFLPAHKRGPEKGSVLFYEKTLCAISSASNNIIIENENKSIVCMQKNAVENMHNS